MSYYDEDTGKYVGYDPYEAHDRRVFEETHYKKYVPTVQELMDSKISRSYIDESKKYIDEPVCESNDFHEQFMYGLEKLMYDAVGDLNKALELSVTDHYNNKDTIRLYTTCNEHIVRDGTETFIVYQVGYPDKVLGVFFDKTVAECFMENYK